MEQNPYAPPAAPIEFHSQASAEAESVRKEHLRTERSIKVAGTLFVLGALVMAAVALGRMTNTGGDSSLLAVALVVLLLGVFQGAVGIGLVRLQSWARIPGIFICCLGLLAFPIGTIINLVILVSLAGKKAGRVMSADYHEIIAQTPHLKPRASKAAIILLIILLVILALIVLFAVLPNM
jgi:hypothetical protein